VIVLLILATVVDILLAVQQIAVSGFIFGGGPEGGHGDPSGVAMWSIGMLACLGTPIAGFVLRSKDLAGIGVLVAWLPPIGALLITFVPLHPY
jgi:hypothetical protein